MAILVWIQTGFAMVILSAALRGVPNDTIEAARIDGASELQIFVCDPDPAGDVHHSGWSGPPSPSPSSRCLTS